VSIHAHVKKTIHPCSHIPILSTFHPFIVYLPSFSVYPLSLLLMYLHIILFTFLLIDLSVHPSVYLSIYLSIPILHPFVWLYIYLPLSLFAY
jgi:hypothetical protein